MAGSGCQMTFDVSPGAGHRVGCPVQLAAVNLEHVPEAVEDLEGCGTSSRCATAASRSASLSSISSLPA